MFFRRGDFPMADLYSYVVRDYKGVTNVPL